MRELSKRALKVKPSATLELTAKVAALRSQGVEVIKFNVGEPDFATPRNICEACKRSLDAGHTKYTPIPGIQELRAAICEKLFRDDGVRYEPDEISYGTGAKQPLFNAIFTLVDSGDEVIIPTPCWVSYVEMVTLADGEPVLVPCLGDGSFYLDIGAIERAITPKTKALILNNPNNPTGAVYPRGDLLALAELAEKHDFYIISDEVYEKLIYGGKQHTCMASVSEGMRQRCVLVNGFSKAYSMTGWRAGYVAAPKEIIRRINGIQGHTTSNATTMVQDACIEALRGPQDDLAAMVREFERRRDFIVRRLNELGLKCRTPEGAFYVMPRVDHLFSRTFHGKKLNDSAGVAAFLLDQAHVAVVPGSAFYAPEYLRISYSTSMENIARGMDQIEKALKALQL